jgi:hypothetical protein
MANRVHAPVHGVQPACGHALAHGRWTESEGSQLIDADDSMLAIGERREPHIPGVFDKAGLLLPER